MFSNYLYKLFTLLLLVGLLFPFLVVFAQDGSSALPRETSSVDIPATVATSTIVAPPLPRATDSQAPLPASTSTPPTPVVAPALTNPTPTATSSPAQNISPTEDTRSNLLLLVALAVLAALPFGYLVTQTLKNKKTKEDIKDTSKCFDIKKLLDKKLEELTDLKGRLKSKAQDTAREKIREAVQETSAGDAFVLIEGAEKEYRRLKKLYEECIVGFERRMFKGTIIENSLSDKSILDKIKLERTYQSGNRVLHDVFVNEEQISKLSKYLDTGPWYAHFWESGKDDVKVVFKDRVFTIRFSDKSTWAEAVAHGKSIGIPSEQLNFPID